MMGKTSSGGCSHSNGARVKASLGGCSQLRVLLVSILAVSSSRRASDDALFKLALPRLLKKSWRHPHKHQTPRASGLRGPQLVGSCLFDIKC